MASFGVLDSYFVYQFVKRLVKPFEKWEAHKKGVIDKEGNIIVKEENRTPEQKDSFKYFDLLVLNLKKLLAKIPGGSSKIATYAAAIFLLREYRTLETDMDILEEKYLKVLTEEIANSANPSHIAGLDNPPKFMGHRIFDVSLGTLMKTKHGKEPKHRYKKYLEDEPHSEEIRLYCRSNPKKSIILRDSKSGQMVFLRRK